MPHVIVKLWPGKTEEQKTLLAEEITHTVVRTLNYSEESVSVAFEEIEPKDWAFKGAPHRDRRQRQQSLLEAWLYDVSPLLACRRS